MVCLPFVVGAKTKLAKTRRGRDSGPFPTSIHKQDAACHERKRPVQSAQTSELEECTLSQIQRWIPCVEVYSCRVPANSIHEEGGQVTDCLIQPFGISETPSQRLR